jgi:arginine exporter protein ArgO
MSVEQALLSFTLAAGLLTITPGLDTALVLRTAAVEGRKRAMLAGIGICSGCLFWGAAASCGLSTLLAVSGFAYNMLRIVGAIYLSYLGIKLFVRAFASFFKQRCRVSLEGRRKHEQFSVVETWLPDEPSQSQSWRVLSELPAAIYSDGCSGLVIQHVAGIDSRGRRAPLVLAANKRD